MDEQKKKLKALEERAKRMKVDFIDLPQYTLSEKLSDKIPFTLAKQFKMVPVALFGNKLMVAMENPGDLYVQEELETRTKMRILPVLADTDDIFEAISRIYCQISENEISISILNEPEFEQYKGYTDPTTLEWFKSVLVKAINRNASDIHIETYENEIRIRYRIDGVITESNTLPRESETKIFSFIKSLARMMIERRNVPQEGTIFLKVRDREILVKVGSLPVLHGERCYMKLMDKWQSTIKVKDLGMDPENWKKVRRLVKAKQGLLLFSGPSDSGVSTTLRSVIHHIAKSEINVFTIENPIESSIPGVNQLEVNSVAGMTTAELIRTVSHHDPDVLMIHKIKDSQIARLSVESALSGQLILGGLYARDAIDTITRIIDFGIEPYYISTILLGVIAQRLVRKVCEKCARPEKVSMDLAREMNNYSIEGTGNVQKGRGCTHCLGTGYKGRTAIFETVPISESLRSLILSGASRASLEDQAYRDGMKGLYTNGLEKVARGITTFEEIKRVLIS